jgi:hypothetical protein
MTIPDLRWSARECVARAKKPLEVGDEAPMRYACLELRSAIENLVYEQLQPYRDELDDDTVRK